MAHRQIHRKECPVLAATLDLAAEADDPALPRLLVPREVPVVFAVVRLGHQHHHVTAKHFVSLVAEGPLGRRIEPHDQAFGVDRDNRGPRGAEHRTALCLALTQLGLELLSRGDVTGARIDHAVQGRCVPLQPSIGTVPAPVTVLELDRRLPEALPLELR